MKTTYPPLGAGYPAVGLVSVRSRSSRVQGYAFIVSGADEAQIVDSGTTVGGRRGRNELALRLAALAVEHGAMIWAWPVTIRNVLLDSPLADRVVSAGDLTNRDEAYRAAVTAAESALATAEPELKRPMVIATDGSRGRATGDGGWAWVREDGSWAHGGCDAVSAFHAELLAIRHAVTSNNAGRLLVLSDSKRSVEVLTARDSSAPAAGGRSEHRIVSEILRATEGRDITYRWVRGHNGHPLNETADRLALLARRSRQQNISDQTREQIAEGILNDYLTGVVGAAAA